jgi:hypothetical protein
VYGWRDSSGRYCYSMPALCPARKTGTTFWAGVYQIAQAAQACPNGYSIFGSVGDDIYGWGLSTTGNSASNMVDCASQCDGSSSCGVFQYNQNGNICALHAFGSVINSHVQGNVLCGKETPTATPLTAGAAPASSSVCTACKCDGITTSQPTNVQGIAVTWYSVATESACGEAAYANGDTVYGWRHKSGTYCYSMPALCPTRVTASYWAGVHQAALVVGDAGTDCPAGYAHLTGTEQDCIAAAAQLSVAYGSACATIPYGSGINPYGCDVLIAASGGPLVRHNCNVIGRNSHYQAICTISTTPTLGR